MVTIKDVAREAGVSVTTVSRALNQHGDVAEVTRARVVDAARTLDYHPNVVARSLQNNRANAIGLMIPIVLHRPQDPFWFEFIGGMATRCAERGLDLVLSAAEDNGAQDPRFQRLIRGRRVDGVLICDIRRHDPRIEALRKQHLPFVAFGRTIEEQNYAYIDVDGELGVIQAMEHLLALGHRRIAFLGVDPEFAFSHYRFAGYRKALARANVRYDPHLVREGLVEGAVAAAFTAMLSLPQPPTAFFAAADFLALPLVLAARRAGLSIPGDISVAVYDDNPMTQHADPPLTAVSQPNRRLGEEAADLLIRQVADGYTPLLQRLFVPMLIQRASTAPPEVRIRDAG